MTIQKRRAAETKEQRAERLAKASLRKQANDQAARNHMMWLAALSVISVRMNRDMIHERVTDHLERDA